MQILALVVVMLIVNCISKVQSGEWESLVVTIGGWAAFLLPVLMAFFHNL